MIIFRTVTFNFTEFTLFPPFSYLFSAGVDARDSTALAALQRRQLPVHQRVELGAPHHLPRLQLNDRL
jgi:hypothetical protein